MAQDVATRAQCGSRRGCSPPGCRPLRSTSTRRAQFQRCFVDTLETETAARRPGEARRRFLRIDGIESLEERSSSSLTLRLELDPSPPLLHLHRHVLERTIVLGVDGDALVVHEAGDRRRREAAPSRAINPPMDSRKSERARWMPIVHLVHADGFAPRRDASPSCNPIRLSAQLCGDRSPLQTAASSFDCGLRLSSVMRLRSMLPAWTVLPHRRESVS